jgi:hypothetical protein
VLAGERPAEILLGREVAEDGALGDPGPLGDVGHGELLVAGCSADGRRASEDLEAPIGLGLGGSSS